MAPAEVCAVARRLLGARLVGRGVTIRLTEVEAYAGAQDPGSHAFRGQTSRNAVMFGPAGHLYCYFTYGMHTCMNYVVGAEGDPSAVLLRAGEVVDGVDLARVRRGPRTRDADLARGPARLTVAAGITLADNGGSLSTPGPLHLVPRRRALPAALISSGPRVGVSGPGGDGAAFPWRYWLTDEPSVSTYRPAKPRRSR